MSSHVALACATVALVTGLVVGAFGAPFVWACYRQWFDWP